MKPNFKMESHVCNTSYIYNMMYNCVCGEGGDGWAYIVCKTKEDMENIASQFQQSFDDLYIINHKPENSYITIDRKDGDVSTQECWHFTYVEPTTNDRKMYDFIFYIG